MSNPLTSEGIPTVVANTNKAYLPGEIGICIFKISVLGIGILTTAPGIGINILFVVGTFE